MKSTIHKLSVLAVATAALFASTAGVRAQSSLADLVAGGSFTSGDMTFSGFSVSQTGTGSLPSLANILVFPGSQLANSSGGFSITGYPWDWPDANGSASPSNSYNLSISYTVSVSDGSLINGSGTAISGEAQGGSSSGSNPTPPANSTTNMNFGLGNYIFDSGNNPISTNTTIQTIESFSPVSVINVTTFS